MKLGKDSKTPFILASASPRRRELLAEAGFTFEVVVSNIEEGRFFEQGLSTAETACKLAMAKAKDVAERFSDRLVIAADTVADFDGEVIGKAGTAKEAEEIMRKLFSKPHKVITAIAMVRLNKAIEMVEYDSTTVFPKELTAGQIAEHIKSGIWKDKAGAYAIQAGNDNFIERIEGSRTNVMGLGMELFKKMLADII